MIAQLPVDEWTDADVDINYEIMRDPDIQRFCRMVVTANDVR
jgi:hypothetical protein